MQVYDLAWSPSGEYIIAGSTDNAARVFTIADGGFLSDFLLLPSSTILFRREDPLRVQCLSELSQQRQAHCEELW